MIDVTAARPADAERKFPVLSGLGGWRKPPEFIPWEVIAPHAEQAKINHSQTLERLAERGGLSWGEMAAVLADRPWHSMKEDDARAAVIKAIAAWNRRASEEEKG